MAPWAVSIHIDPSVKQNTTPDEPRNTFSSISLDIQLQKNHDKRNLEKHIQERMIQATKLIEIPTTQSEE